MSKRRIFVNLSPEEIRTLKEVMVIMARKKKYRARFRGNMIWDSFQMKWSARQLAKHFGVSERTIYRWYKRYARNRAAGLYDKQRPFKLTTEQINHLFKISGWDKSYLNEKKARKCHWSYRRIAGWVKEQWGITISHERVRQLIQQTYQGDYYFW